MIFGLPGSGKSTISSLLDDHKEVYNLPHADKILRFFYEKTFFNKQESKSSNFYSNEVEKNNVFYLEDFFGSKNYKITSYDFLEYLYAHFDYNRIETYSNASFFPVPQFSGDDFGVEFSFNFERFHALNKECLFDNSIKTAEEVLDIIYGNFFKVYFAESYKCENSISFMAPNSIDGMEFVLKNFKNVKIIYMERDFEGLMLTAALRVKAGWIKSKNDKFDLYKELESWINKGYAERLLDDLEKITMLKKKYANKIHFMNLNDLVDNKEDEIRNLAKFLEIKDEEGLSIPSYLGKEYTSEFNPISKINDNPEKFFTQKEYDLLSSFKEKGKVYKKYYYKKRIKELLKKSINSFRRRF